MLPSITTSARMAQSAQSLITVCNRLTSDIAYSQCHAKYVLIRVVHFGAIRAEVAVSFLPVPTHHDHKRIIPQVRPENPGGNDLNMAAKPAPHAHVNSVHIMHTCGISRHLIRIITNTIDVFCTPHPTNLALLHHNTPHLSTPIITKLLLRTLTSRRNRQEIPHNQGRSVQHTSANFTNATPHIPPTSFTSSGLG